MASTFTDLLRLEKQLTGENDSTWGDKANAVFEMIEDAIAGRAAVVMPADANYTLTTGNSVADEARMAILNIASAGALTATRDIIVPTSAKKYIVKNATTGGQSIRVKTAAGTGITIPSGRTGMVFCDGTNVVMSNDFFNDLTVSGNATLGDGVGDNHIVTGGLTITDDSSSALNVIRSGAGDIISIGANAAGGGAGVVVLNNAGNDYEPLSLQGEVVGIYARTGPGTNSEIVRVTNTALVFPADNTQDIGAAGATRPRDVFVARNLNIAGAATLGDAATDSHAVNGQLTITDDTPDGLVVARSGGGDFIVMGGNVAGSGAVISGRNSASTDYKQLALQAEVIGFYARTGLNTVAEIVRVDSGGLIFLTDNAYDIGRTATFRPRDLNLARNLVVAGNATLGDAVGDAHIVNGTMTIFQTANIAGLKVAGASGADRLRLVPNTAGSGASIDSLNSAESDYELMQLISKHLAIYARTGVATVVEVVRVNNTGLIFPTDNTYDIGATGATRPRDLHVARNVLVGGTGAVTGALKWGTGLNTFGLVVKRKTADEAVASSTVLQDDDHLTFPIGANEEWVVDVVLDVTGLLNTTGIKLAVNAPAGATVALTVSGVGAVGSAATTNSGTRRSTTIGATLDFTASEWPNASNGFIHMHYWVLNGATPGNITVQFAQSTSSGTPVTVAKGSKLVAHRVA